MDNINNTESNWGIVELMGHKVVAGLISKSELLGKPMLRIDVPATSAYPEFTQFYGDGSIYCVTFVSEQVARMTAEETKVNPVSVYVPELITKEQLNQVKEQYNRQIERLRNQLPATTGGPQWDTDDEDSGFDDDERD